MIYYKEKSKNLVKKLYIRYFIDVSNDFKKLIDELNSMPDVAKIILKTQVSIHKICSV
jgi:hypothetical protein